MDASTLAWLDARLHRTGPVEDVKHRSWGTVWRVPTVDGPVWCKATTPTTAHEVSIYACLAEAAPDLVPTVVALDAVAGLLVLRDHAPDLGDPGTVLPATVLARYARLQRTVAPHADALVAAGVPDMRPAVLPHRFDEAVDAVAGFAARHGTAADVAAVAEVAAGRAAFAERCARLADSPLPPTLDHGDLHAGNVLTGGGAVRFFDWGDASVAHPFVSMFVPVQVAGRRGSAAYLDAFADTAAPHELETELDLALTLATVIRTHTWIRAVGVDGRDERFARAPLECLVALRCG